MTGEGRTRRIRIRNGLSLSESDLEWRFIRAAGPGGQNVNKVATSAQLRFVARRHLPPDVFSRLRRLAGRRLNHDGVLTITARAERSQERNRAQALGRLIELLRAAAEPPTPRTPTRPTAASRSRRLESKRRRSGAKDRRRKVTHLDD